MMRESQFKKKILTLIKKQYPEVYIYQPPNVMAVRKAGVPDVLMSFDGTFIAIEFKVGKNTLTPLQKYTLTKIAKSGGKSAVIKLTNENVIIYSVDEDGEIKEIYKDGKNNMAD